MKFEGFGNVNFGIHYDVRDLVGRPAVLQGSGKGAFFLESGSKQDYCWTWRNRGKVTIEADIRNDRASLPALQKSSCDGYGGVIRV